MKYAPFFGHVGLLFGFLAVILMLYPLYVALDPPGTVTGALLLPVLFWFVALMFVLAEFVELRHPD